MKQISIIVFLVLSISNGCHYHKPDPTINKIWIGDYQKIFYLDPTIRDEIIVNNLPLIADFTNLDTAIIIDQAGYKYETNWTLVDSVLTYDSIDYRIVYLTTDSLIISPYLIPNLPPVNDSIKNDDQNEVSIVPVKDEYYVFRKVSEYKNNFSVEEIREKLENKDFRLAQKDDKSFMLPEKIEFLDNGVAISDRTDDESDQILYQDDCWKIHKYKGYLFLSFFHSWYQDNGCFNYGYQMLDISNKGFKLKANRGSNPVEFSYIEPTTNTIGIDSILGSWYSVNDTTKFYSNYLPARYIKQGRIELFSDTLFYRFYSDSLIIDNNQYAPIKCKWRLSNDKNLVIYEYPIENPRFTGYHVEYSRIDKIEKDSLFLELFFNSMKTKIDTPYLIFLNRYQNFVKLD